MGNVKLVTISEVTFSVFTYNELIRKVLRLQVSCTPEQAVVIARQECLRRSCVWMEPVAVFEYVFEYVVEDNSDRFGGHVFVHVRVSDGTVSRFCTWGRQEGLLK